MHTLGDIARFIDAELIGDASLEINSLSASSKAKKGRVCTYGTIFANNNGFGNGATIGNVFTVNLSTNMDAHTDE
jgi:hypothetical protein